MPLERKPAILAGLLSFSVYLLPLIGPHSLTLLGAGLLMELTRGRERGAIWMATDVAFALLLQSFAFGLCYWFFRKPRVLTGLLVIAAIPAFIAIAQVSYLVAIPSLFLIEDDTQPEIAAWPVICTADNSSMVHVQTSQQRTSAAISEVIVQSSTGEYRLMRVPGCEVTSLPLPQPTVQPGGRVDFTLSLSYFVPGRGLLFHKLETPNATMRWAYLKDASSEPISAVLFPTDDTFMYSSEGKTYVLRVWE